MRRKTVPNRDAGFGQGCGRPASIEGMMRSSSERAFSVMGLYRDTVS
jgi:hypothetical protein